MPDEDPGALKVTISKFYRPSGASTQLKGVTSDIVLPSLTDVLDISEGSLENPLPWDTIPAARFASTGRVRSTVGALQARSAERIAKDPGFASLHEDRERLRKAREEKSVSLNEVERRREKSETEVRVAARKKDRATRVRPPTWEITLKNVDTAGPGTLVKQSAAETAAATAESKTKGKDKDKDKEEDTGEATSADELILTEAQRILRDSIGVFGRDAAAR